MTHPEAPHTDWKMFHMVKRLQILLGIMGCPFTIVLTPQSHDIELLE